MFTCKYNFVLALRVKQVIGQDHSGLDSCSPSCSLKRPARPPLRFRSLRSAACMRRDCSTSQWVARDPLNLARLCLLATLASFRYARAPVPCRTRDRRDMVQVDHRLGMTSCATAQLGEVIPRPAIYASTYRPVSSLHLVDETGTGRCVAAPNLPHNPSQTAGKRSSRQTEVQLKVRGAEVVLVDRDSSLACACTYRLLCVSVHV